MSDDIFNSFAEGMAELNTELTSAFMKDGWRCFLLKRAGQSSQFEVVQELISGVYIKFSEYRSQMLFRYATTDDAFSDKVFQTSDIAFGVPNNDDEIEVFTIEDGSRDIISPNASNPFWKLYGTKVTEERFTV